MQSRLNSQGRTNTSAMGAGHGNVPINSSRPTGSQQGMTANRQSQLSANRPPSASMGGRQGGSATSNTNGGRSWSAQGNTTTSGRAPQGFGSSNTIGPQPRRHSPNAANRPPGAGTVNNRSTAPITGGSARYTSNRPPSSMGGGNRSYTPPSSGNRGYSSSPRSDSRLRMVATAAILLLAAIRLHRVVKLLLATVAAVRVVIAVVVVLAATVEEEVPTAAAEVVRTAVVVADPTAAVTVVVAAVAVDTTNSHPLGDLLPAAAIKAGLFFTFQSARLPCIFRAACTFGHNSFVSAVLHIVTRRI